MAYLRRVSTMEILGEETGVKLPKQPVELT